MFCTAARPAADHGLASRLARSSTHSRVVALASTKHVCFAASHLHPWAASERARGRNPSATRAVRPRIVPGDALKSLQHFRGSADALLCLRLGKRSASLYVNVDIHYT